MAHLPTVAVGISSLILLVVIHKFAPKIPAALAVIMVSILASSLFNLEAYGVHIIGYIPAGLLTQPPAHRSLIIICLNLDNIHFNQP
jgi:sulfate permease, SulP family